MSKLMYACVFDTNYQPFYHYFFQYPSGRKKCVGYIPAGYERTYRTKRVSTILMMEYINRIEYRTAESLQRVLLPSMSTAYTPKSLYVMQSLLHGLNT